VFNIYMRLYNWNVCSTCNFNNIHRFILWRFIISYLSLDLSWLGNYGFLVFNWYWIVRNSFKWNNNITFFKRFFLQILLFKWFLISFIWSKVLIWIWLDNSFFFSFVIYLSNGSLTGTLSLLFLYYNYFYYDDFFFKVFYFLTLYFKDFYFLSFFCFLIFDFLILFFSI